MGNSTPPVLTPLAPIGAGPMPSLDQDPEVAELRRLHQQDKQAQMSLWEASMRTAVRTDPLLAAEADRLVKITGIPLGEAEKNVDFLRGMARIKQMQDDRIEQVNPTLFRSMQNIEVARKIWDDQQLPMLERWARAFEVGQLTAERGRAGAGLMAGSDNDANAKRIAEIGARLKEIGPVTGFFPSAAEIVGTQISSVTRAAGVGLATGTAAAGINLAVSAVAPPVALATPLTFAGGFKVGFLSTLAVDVFQVEAGNAYASMVEAKYDPDRAFRAAVGIGLVNSALEIVGGSLATGTSGALRRAVSRDIFRRAAKEVAQEAVPGMVRSAVTEFGVGYTKAVTGETFTEVVQELVTIAGEMMAARGDDKTMTPEGVSARLWEVASKTAQGMAVLGVGGGYKAARDARLAQLKEALRAGADSPTVKRDPATAEGFVGEVLNDVPGAPKVVYVDAKVLAEALAQSDKEPGDGTLRKSAEDVIEGVVPGFKEQLADAVQNGGEVELPTKTLLTSIASQLPGVADAIVEHISVKEGEKPPAMTAEENKDSEQQAQQETADEEIFRAMKEAAVGQQDAKARGESMKEALAKSGVTGEQEQGRYLQRQAERDRDEAVSRIRDTIEEELSPAIREATPSVRATDVRLLARIISETVRGLADKASKDPTAKVDPEEFFSQHRLAFAVAKLPEGAQEQPGRGGFAPDPADETRRRLLMILQPGTDVSTVLHELTHYYVEVLERVAAVDNAPEGIRAEFDVLLKRWGYSMETWRGMDAKAREKHLEDIAYNAEDYFATGEAPSPELVPLFATIRKWLTRLYGQVRAILSSTYLRKFNTELPALTPELRSFFDRMLASKETVDMVVAQRQQAALFDPAVAEKLGISPEKAAELEELSRKSVEDAQEAVAIAAVKGASRYQAARRGAEKDAQTKLDASRERIRSEVDKDVGGRPVYRARAFLQNGEVAGDDGTMQSAKLDTDAVRDILGDDAELAAYEAQRDAARAAAMEAAGKDAERIAEGQAPAVAAEVARNRAALEKERAAFEKQATEQAKEKVGAEPVYRAISFIENGTIDDNGVSKPARLDRGAVRLLAGKTKLGGASEVFDRIPAKLLRKGGASPDIVAAMFQFPNATTMVEAIAEANFDRDVAAEVARLKKESGLFDKALDKAAVVTAAGGDPTAVALASFRAGERAAREVAKVSRPALVSDLLANLTRKNGTNPDAMAQQLGFSTGDEMLRALLDAPPIEETVENETNRRLEAEEPLADPAEFRRTVEGALRGKAATRLASELIRALLNNSRTTAEIEASAKQAARIVLLRTPVGQISTKRYALNELRAGKAAREALKSGKVAEALDAMRKYLLQHYLTKLSIDIEKEVAAFTDKVRHTYQKPDAEIIKAKRNLDVVQAMRVLLSRHGAIGQIPAKNAADQFKTLAERNPGEHNRLMAQITNASPELKPWRELSLEQWRVVEDAASQLWHESKRGEQFRVAGELVLRSEVRGKLSAKLVDTFGADKKPDVAFFGALVSILSSMTRLEAWALRADGGEVGGPWQTYVHRVLEAAQTAKDAETVKHRAWFKGWLQAFGDLGGGKINASKWLGKGVEFKNRGHLLGAIMAMGTDSNFRNMVLGEKWAEQINGELVTLDGAPFAPRWLEFLGAMADLGKLRKSDFDNAQAGVEYIGENFKGRVFDTTREVWGFYPKEVEAQAFDTPFGRYPGGYFPSKVDLDRADLGDRSQLDAIAQGKENFVAANTNVPRGQTITRKDKAVHPRNLDIGVMWDHIDEALSIIHLQPALTDVAGLFRGGELVATLKQADPNAMRNVILPAMNRLARQSIMAPSNKHLRAIVNWAKQNASLAFLGFSPRNAAQQITGLSNGVVYSSVGGIFSVLRRGVMNPAAVIRAVRDASEFMGIHWDTRMQQMAQDIEQLANPSKIGKAQAKLREAAFFGQRFAQMFTDAVVWQAAFDKANIDLKGMDPTALKAEAVQRADQAVRMSQGNKSPLDVPEILAGPALAQLFTQFGDYPNTVLNQNIAAPTGRRFATVMFTLVIPTLMASSIALAFAGFRIGKGSRSDDDEAEDIIAHLLGAQVKGAFSMIPGLGGAGGSIANALIDRLGATLFGEDLPKLAGEQFLRNSPFAADALIGAIQNMAQGDASPRDKAMFWSMATGFPLQVFGNAANYMRRVDRGQSRPANALDYVRGLVNGR